MDDTALTHDAWLCMLDAVGAAATRAERWFLWAIAPQVECEDARALWAMLMRTT
jgi:hypothetical protein